MEYDEILAYALSFNGAYLDYPFGPETAVLKVRALDRGAGKVFALLWPQDHEQGRALQYGTDAQSATDATGPAATRINLKCDPALAEQLRAVHPQITPGYHMNKRHWNSVAVPREGGLAPKMIRNLIEDSYDLVVSSLPKRDHLLLDWHPSDQR